MLFDAVTCRLTKSERLSVDIWYCLLLSATVYNFYCVAVCSWYLWLLLFAEQLAAANGSRQREVVALPSAIACCCMELVSFCPYTHTAVYCKLLLSAVAATMWSWLPFVVICRCLLSAGAVCSRLLSAVSCYCLLLAPAASCYLLLPAVICCIALRYNEGKDVKVNTGVTVFTTSHRIHGSQCSFDGYWTSSSD